MTDITVDSRFGKLGVDPAQIITFPNGIPGFESSTRWKLFHEVDEQGNWVNGIVIHLLSVEDGTIVLPLTDPTLFGLSYDLLLSDNEVADLKMEDPNDVIVLMALSSQQSALQSPPFPAMNGLYANITAPILINTKSRIGMQKTIDGKDAKVEFKPLPQD